ncbi:MAG: hypothetical protein AAFP77_19650 [Bacteroidota bacterium]
MIKKLIDDKTLRQNVIITPMEAAAIMQMVDEFEKTVTPGEGFKGEWVEYTRRFLNRIEKQESEGSTK